MAGRFEGLSDAEWKLFADIFSEKARRGRGMPAVHPRRILNSLLITGSRWGGAIFRKGRNGHQEVQRIAVSQHGILMEH